MSNLPFEIYTGLAALKIYKFFLVVPEITSKQNALSKQRLLRVLALKR